MFRVALIRNPVHYSWLQLREKNISSFCEKNISRFSEKNISRFRVPVLPRPLRKIVDTAFLLELDQLYIQGSVEVIIFPPQIIIKCELLGSLSMRHSGTLSGGP